ncbi:MAG: patatin family protein [Clostridia bacterium]|nr:patatin family protein [Clostridia bacterium]
MKNKMFSRINDLLDGTAPDNVINGCMVLEGGAFRGVYTEGVLDFLMQNGINMSCTVGVSAGAINGANYVSGQIGRSARTNLKHRHNNDYVGLGAVRKNDGIIGFDFLFNELEKTDPFNKERFFEPSRRLVAVVTNLLTGEAEYIEKDSQRDIFQAIRASASLPFVSKPVYIDGKPYLDGGCVCKIPYQWAINEGYDKIIVIKTRDAGFRKPISKTETSKICNAAYRNYPEFAEILAKNDIMYNSECDELDELSKKGRVFVISPSEPININRFESDTEKLGELYFLGVEDAKNSFDALCKYLNSEKTEA